MKNFFRKLFNLYAGEEKSAFLFASLGFLWALGVTSGQKYADALFLLHVGADSLPFAYMLTATILIIFAALFIGVFNTNNIPSIFRKVLIAGICFYTGVLFLSLGHIGIETQWLWYALKIFGSIFFALSVTCFWTFIDQYYHLQDAKRLYSLFTSAIFLGVATTGFLMRSGWIELPALIIGMILLFIFAIRRIRGIEKSVKPVYDEDQLEGYDEQQTSIRNLIPSILSSKFTLFLMLGNFLTYVLLVLTEFNYLSDFDAYFNPENFVVLGEEGQAHLTIFLGQSLAIVSIFNLIFGLFFYSRLVRQYGITTLVLFTPAFLVLTFSGWLIGDSLIFPLMGFFVVEGMLYIIDDNDFTLLLNAVPARIKYQVRLIIESFFEPTGMLVSSLLLTFTSINSKVLGLILASVALVVALLMRRNYLKAIFINLSDSAIHFQRTSKDWFLTLNKKARHAMERRLLALLHIGDESSKNFSIETLVNIEARPVLPKVLEHASNLRTKSKIKFIDTMAKSSFATDSQFLDLLHAWLNETTDFDLKRAIHFHLARHGLLHPDKIYHDLENSDLLLKGAAILSLKKSWAHLPPSAATMNRSLAAQHMQSLLDSQDEAEMCMGIIILGIDSMPQDIDILIPFLKHKSLKVARAAASAISQMADRHSLRYSPTLLSQLESASDTEIRQSCLRALGKMADSSLAKEIIIRSTHFRPNERRLAEAIIANIGLRMVPLLIAIVKDTRMQDRPRILAARVLGRLALPQLRKHLHSILSIEIDRAYFYFDHYHSIHKQNPNVDVGHLRDALLSGYESVLDFIIQILGVAGESEDCELLSRGLRSPSPKVRSHVIETLEKSCKTSLFKSLFPLIADMPHEEKLRLYKRAHPKILSLPELLDKMSKSPLLGDRIIAAALKYQYDLPNWRDSLRQQMATHEEIFHHFAYELLET